VHGAVGGDLHDLDPARRVAINGCIQRGEACGEFRHAAEVEGNRLPARHRDGDAGGSGSVELTGGGYEVDRLLGQRRAAGGTIGEEGAGGRVGPVEYRDFPLVIVGLGKVDVQHHLTADIVVDHHRCL